MKVRASMKLLFARTCNMDIHTYMYVSVNVCMSSLQCIELESVGSLILNDSVNYQLFLQGCACCIVCLYVCCVCVHVCNRKQRSSDKNLETLPFSD